MFLRLCKDALDITIGIFIVLLLIFILLFLIGVGIYLYHINIILGIIFTPILVYLFILILLGVVHLDDKRTNRRKL